MDEYLTFDAMVTLLILAALAAIFALLLMARTYARLKED